MKKLYRTRLNTEIVIKGKYGTETLKSKGRYSDMFYGEKLENTEYTTTNKICINNEVYSDIKYTRSSVQMYLPYTNRYGDISYKKVDEKDFISYKSRLEYREILLSNMSIDGLKSELSAKEFIEVLKDNCLGGVTQIL